MLQRYIGNYRAASLDHSPPEMGAHRPAPVPDLVPVDSEGARIDADTTHVRKTSG